jgi:flavin-dependent thymidylate synthase
MAPSKVLRTFHMKSEISGEYEVQIVGGAVPTVELVTWSEDPVGTMAKAARGYTGVYSNEAPDPYEEDSLVKDILNTKLATPMEMVHFTFLIQDASRAWTHQAVRYRIGTAFIQESMRFLGHKSVYKVLATYDDVKDMAFDQYAVVCARAVETYVMMRDQGIPDQDARGVLPTNILTRMFWDMSLSTLRNVINTRWCCQAQGNEWLPIVAQFKKLLTIRWPEMHPFLTAPIDRGEPCGFNASFDRPCVWKARSDLQRIENVIGSE